MPPADLESVLSFSCERYRFAIEVTRIMILPPYKGSVFRGALGNALRRAVCVRSGKDCRGCLVESKCLYAAVFEPSPPPGFVHAGRFEEPPRPFVLTPPLTSRQSFHPGDRLEFDLVLMGPALDALPYFVYAFQEIGRQGLGRERGKYRLLNVDLLRGEEAYRVYDGDAQTLSAHPAADSGPTHSPHEDAQSVTLNFITPLRLKHKGDLVTRLTFPLLFERLAQRITLLSAFYGPRDGIPDLADLIQQSNAISSSNDQLYWYDWERYSGRQKGTMKFGGLKGTIGFEGNLGPFLPYLKCGELLNVGQGTTFGLGRISMKL